MSSEFLSIGLDVVVLVSLGVTIYYALKLSKSLNSFRAYRQEFNGLINELNKNIEEAYNAIEKMKQSGGESGGNLEGLLKESKLLADELQFINDAGNSLAKRLEGLAEKNRRVVQGVEDEADEYDEQLYKHVEQTERGMSDSAGSFVIQDREFGANDGFEEQGTSGLESQAEKELFQALQRNKRQASH